MSFGMTKIYPFPAVQYIPLTITNIQQDVISDLNPRKERALLVIGDELSKWREVLAGEYGIFLQSLQDSNALPILALNLHIDDVKYRGFYVTMTGAKKLGFYQYCTIPKNYFYKKNLFFELYDSETEERLAHTSI